MTKLHLIQNTQTFLGLGHMVGFFRDGDGVIAENRYVPGVVEHF